MATTVKIVAYGGKASVEFEEQHIKFVGAWQDVLRQVEGSDGYVEENASLGNLWSVSDGKIPVVVCNEDKGHIDFSPTIFTEENLTLIQLFLKGLQGVELPRIPPPLFSTSFEAHILKFYGPDKLWMATELEKAWSQNKITVYEFLKCCHALRIRPLIFLVCAFVASKLKGQPKHTFSTILATSPHEIAEKASRGVRHTVASIPSSEKWHTWAHQLPCATSR